MEETRYGLKVSLPVRVRPSSRAGDRCAQVTRLRCPHDNRRQADAQDQAQSRFSAYVILGACNPSLAHRALEAELEVGLLLPCNVIVYETGPSTSVVAAMAPLAALGVVGENVMLADVAREADGRLRGALASLELQTRTAPALRWRCSATRPHRVALHRQWLGARGFQVRPSVMLRPRLSECVRYTGWPTTMASASQVRDRRWRKVLDALRACAGDSGHTNGSSTYVSGPRARRQHIQQGTHYRALTNGIVRLAERTAHRTRLSIRRAASSLA